MASSSSASTRKRASSPIDSEPASKRGKVDKSTSKPWKFLPVSIPVTVDGVTANIEMTTHGSLQGIYNSFLLFKELWWERGGLPRAFLEQTTTASQAWREADDATKKRYADASRTLRLEFLEKCLAAGMPQEQYDAHWMRISSMKGKLPMLGKSAKTRAREQASRVPQVSRAAPATTSHPEKASKARKRPYKTCENMDRSQSTSSASTSTASSSTVADVFARGPAASSRGRVLPQAAFNAPDAHGPSYLPPSPSNKDEQYYQGIQQVQAFKTQDAPEFFSSLAMHGISPSFSPDEDQRDYHEVQEDQASKDCISPDALDSFSLTMDDIPMLPGDEFTALIQAQSRAFTALSGPFSFGTGSDHDFGFEVGSHQRVGSF
ncbi:hypothetical protein OF83DRAFT_1085111 [Amylostereum chailletii]|nr:hypothetical protein OF83DRAFT_1085111 [Amylostereum chailletii]